MQMCTGGLKCISLRARRLCVSQTTQAELKTLPYEKLLGDLKKKKKSPTYSGHKYIKYM